MRGGWRCHVRVRVPGSTWHEDPSTAKERTGAQRLRQSGARGTAGCGGRLASRAAPCLFCFKSHGLALEMPKFNTAPKNGHECQDRLHFSLSVSKEEEERGLASLRCSTYRSDPTSAPHRGRTVSLQAFFLYMHTTSNGQPGRPSSGRLVMGHQLDPHSGPTCRHGRPAPAASRSAAPSPRRPSLPSELLPRQPWCHSAGTRRRQDSLCGLITRLQTRAATNRLPRATKMACGNDSTVAA